MARHRPLDLSYRLLVRFLECLRILSSEESKHHQRFPEIRGTLVILQCQIH